MKILQKDIAELFDLLWSEKRVEKILSSNWEELLEDTLRMSKDIDESLRALLMLETTSHKKKYINCLSENLQNSLLVILAKELKNNQGKKTKTDFSDEGGEEVFDELDDENMKKVVFH
jgi:hypothetical protein